MVQVKTAAFAGGIAGNGGAFDERGIAGGVGVDTTAPFGGGVAVEKAIAQGATAEEGGAAAIFLGGVVAENAIPQLAIGLDPDAAAAAAAAVAMLEGEALHDGFGMGKEKNAHGVAAIENGFSGAVGALQVQGLGDGERGLERIGGAGDEHGGPGGCIAHHGGEGGRGRGPVGVRGGVGAARRNVVGGEDGNERGVEGNGGGHSHDDGGGGGVAGEDGVGVAGPSGEFVTGICLGLQYEVGAGGVPAAGGRNGSAGIGGDGEFHLGGPKPREGGVVGEGQGHGAGGAGGGVVVIECPARA